MTPVILASQLRQALAAVREARSQLYPMQLDHVPGAATAWWKLSPAIDGLEQAIAALEPAKEEDGEPLAKGYDRAAAYLANVARR